MFSSRDTLAYTFVWLYSPLEKKFDHDDSYVEGEEKDELNNSSDSNNWAADTTPNTATYSTPHACAFVFVCAPYKYTTTTHLIQIWILYQPKRPVRSSVTTAKSKRKAKQ